MLQGTGRNALLVLALAAPGIIVIAALFGFGAIGGTAATLAAAALLAVAAPLAIPLVFSLAGARAAIEGLGPDAAVAGAPPTSASLRLSLAGQAIWPAVVRLQRSWRQHADRAEAQRDAVEAIIAALPDPLIWIDGRRRILGANAAAAEFVSPGSEPRDLAAALRNPLVLAAADSVLLGEPSRSVEFALSGPVERVLRAQIARIADASGTGATAIVTLHDVTALKRTEQMRADFVANAGHELKTPLAALIGFIETLLGPAREDDTARERFLGIMREQAGRMARLVDDLLSLSRIELNEHVPPTGRVALAAVIDEVARGLELRALERDIRIVRALPDDLSEVQGERDELAQIFQNLLDNAVKYGRPHSEVTVIGAMAGGAAPAMVQVAVVDHGDGIAGEHLPRLTERFYRVDTARSRELGGTGLGLAIVKHILNRHRGRLEIASRLGEGSSFTVWLPAAANRSVIEES